MNRPGFTKQGLSITPESNRYKGRGTPHHPGVSAPPNMKHHCICSCPICVKNPSNRQRMP